MITLTVRPPLVRHTYLHQDDLGPHGDHLVGIAFTLFAETVPLRVDDDDVGIHLNRFVGLGIVSTQDLRNCAQSK